MINPYPLTMCSPRLLQILKPPLVTHRLLDSWLAPRARKPEFGVLLVRQPCILTLTATRHIVRGSRTIAGSRVHSLLVVARVAGILSPNYPLRLAGRFTPRAYIPIIVDLNSLDAFGTPPPSEFKIVKTNSQKVFDRFVPFLPTLGLCMLWLASFDEVFSVIFSVMFTTVVLSERFFVSTFGVVTENLYLFALFFISLVNRYKMTF